MPEDAPRPAQAAIRTDLGAIFVSLELSRRTWLITSLSPGGGEKMMAYKRGEPRVCSMARAPTPQEEAIACATSSASAQTTSETLTFRSSSYANFREVLMRAAPSGRVEPPMTR